MLPDVVLFLIKLGKINHQKQENINFKYPLLIVKDGRRK